MRKDHLIKQIEKLKPRDDAFGLSRTHKAKIKAYNKVIHLINNYQELTEEESMEKLTNKEIELLIDLIEGEKQSADLFRGFRPKNTTEIQRDKFYDNLKVKIVELNKYA